jgi:hypothetical protein
MRLIWAWSLEDPQMNESQPSLHYHGLGAQRGVRSIFMKVLGKPTTFPDDPNHPDQTIKHWDITMYNVSHCSMASVPSSPPCLFLLLNMTFPDEF